MIFPSFLSGPEPSDYQVLRGHGLMTARDAGRHGGGGATFPLLGIPMPDLLRFRTMVIQGHQGTGKTLTILQIIRAALERMRDPGSRERLLIIDCKGDLTSIVLGLMRVLCPGVPTYLLNPFDRLGYRLDPHEFVQDPTQITRLVHSLTFRKRDARTDDFFDSSARMYLMTLLKILQTTTPGRWSWRELYHLATDRELLLHVIRKSKLGRGKAGADVQKTFAGIVATIDAWLAPFESTFASWDGRPPIPFSQFLRGRGVAILTAPESQREVLAPFARAMLSGAKDQLLTDTGRDPRSQTTLVLDEFADLSGIIDVILPFFGKSRAAKVAIVCAWQSWPAVCLANGEGPMKALLDNAGIKVWFACGPESADIAARDCRAAEIRRREVSYGWSHSNNGTTSSTNVNFRVEMRQNVIPGEIQALAYPDKPDFLVRAYVTASHLPGPAFAAASYRSFVNYLNRLPKVPSYRPRPASALWLKPWDDQSDGYLMDDILGLGD